MRYTNHVSIWPVGLSGGARWAGPIVQHGKVVKFHTNWAPNRTFPIDMAGFAIGLKYLLKEKPLVKFNSLAKRGFLEPTFLESLTTMNELEPLADNCSKVYSYSVFIFMLGSDPSKILKSTAKHLFCVLHF